MNPVDYIQNALLRQDGILKFVPKNQCDLFDAALVELEQDGHVVYRMSLMNVETELELLHRASGAISAPSVIENWGMFGDWMNKLSFLVPQGQGCFFCMDDALLFWQNKTSIAGILSNQFQSISVQWAQRGTFLLGIMSCAERGTAFALAREVMEGAMGRAIFRVTTAIAS